MRSSFAATSGLQLAKTPNHRQQVARRRLLAICAMLGLALVSGVIGTLTTPKAGEPGARVETGPFSYFPTE